MERQGKTSAQEAIFPCRIYSIFPAVVFWCLCLNISFCQETGSYRTIASGNFENVAIWQVYDGSVWAAAATKPTLLNDIYIDQTRTVTLTANESVKSVFINAELNAGEKLNLNGFNLDVYGALRAFSGAAPGVPSGSWNSQNWIGNSVTSTITFKGTSRVIIPKNAWSGFTTQSRYSVIFEPEEGNTLTIEEPFKAVRFTIRSGSLLQKLDVSVIPNFCSSLTFNTETTFYPSGPFGDFIIEPNGTLITECDQNIIARSISGSVSAGLIDLQNGAELILLGTSPQIEAATLQLNGKVTFRKNSGTQNFISKSFAGSAVPSTFNDLEIQGSQNVSLPPTIALNGNMSQTGSGQFQLLNTHLTLQGTDDQMISGFALSTQDLTVDKPGGEVKLEQNLNVLRNLTMTGGSLDFQNNTLTLNNSGTGSLNYQGGSWENLTTFTYSNVPTTLNATNGTFPFGDRYQGGIRKVQMLGTNAGGNLTINYTEFDGADHDPGFNDNDDTPILYQLLSYFQFSGLSPSSNQLELKISADKLIVDEPEDLRLVGTGYAAPGSHIESTDEVNLWAIRSLAFNDLPGNNFTVGSFRTLSILPTIWLSLSAKAENNLAQISWSVASEKNNEKFEIYRFDNPSDSLVKIGEVPSLGDSDIPASYSYLDEMPPKSAFTYYQIKKLDLFGRYSCSHVISLENNLREMYNHLSIYPNPHSSGKIHIALPDSFNTENAQTSIFTTQGHLISSFNFNEFELSEKLEILNPGIYLVKFSNTESILQTRWIKH
ncbi:hypothetical protein J2X69_001165 [Algoriphagus sp. 4150]|uniref:T9SS type A sorting domain-containing protein n=1 Tax=Algoriphagus sp. 4150 TaxID=2817756 RepID=UPI0028592870|nr:T9SS type A sorting domain-containing protein [Algoriphagus sp. 4150]MDR7128833.1 hypothetical protein [Algoriphagus sp. 4150]